MTVRAASQVEHFADPLRKSGWLGNRPDPQGLIAQSPKIDLMQLDRLHDQSVLSAAQFDLPLMRELMKLAAYMQLRKFEAGHALEDKILAASRAGIETVILPRRNEKDLVDVPEEVRSAIELRLVDTIEEVLAQALEDPA